MFRDIYLFTEGTLKYICLKLHIHRIKLRQANIFYIHLLNY